MRNPGQLLLLSCLFGGVALQGAEVQRLDKGWTYDDGIYAETVSIPHCWNAIDGADGGPHDNHSVDGTGYRRGAMTYTRTLPDPAKNKRYFLRFEGASIRTAVEVNGQSIGKHDGAFGAFAFEITKSLKPSDNTLKVVVDNSFTLDIAPLSGDFTMFGGLYRPVTLFETGPLCFQRAGDFAHPGISFVNQQLTDDMGILTIEAEISGPVGANTELIFSTKHVGQRIESRIPVTAEGKIKGNLRVPNPIRWDGVKNPHLYPIRATLTVDKKPVDEVVQRWGFRTLEITPNKGLQLNGKTIRVRGVNRHQDRDGKGWAISEADQREDMEIMREMGVTGVRLAHYPHSTCAYDLCDEYGFIVWPEIPIVERVTNGAAFADNAKLQMREMIAQHRNHPCIPVWGTANEIGAGINGRMSANKASAKLLNEIYQIAKASDSMRYCGITANPLSRKENDCHDLVGYNTYPGWYGKGKPADMEKSIRDLCQKYPAKGVSINEYGAGGSLFCHEIPAKHPVTVSPWHPEEYQALCHEGQYRAIKNAPIHLWGSFVWNMFDFGADRRKEGDRLGTNDKGLVTYDRKTRKDVYYFYQANWTEKPMLRLASRRFTQRPASANEFKVYSNCPTVELFLDGKSLGTQSPNDLATFMWEAVTLLPGKHTVEAVGTKDNQKIKDSYTFEVI